jgi:hypothetical protein
MSKSVDKIQWHPGFCGATELELRENKSDLEFKREYNLSKEPIRVDLLIIKKYSNVKLKNEIGSIFKKHNIIEYKNPSDELNIDVFFKTIGYACLYKGLGDTVDEIPANELTVSMFRDIYHRKLMSILKKMGFSIVKKFSGIYYVMGNVPFSTQIVVTSQLSESHSSLRILSKNAKEVDIRNFLEETSQLIEPGDRNNIDAVLQVSTLANKAVYQSVKEDFMACEALRELMKDEIDEEKVKSWEQGTQSAILSNIKNLMKNLKFTAEQAMIALDVPEEEREKYREKL